MKEKNPEVGVIVARFQVHELHEAHLELVNHVRNSHSKVLIFLGLSPCKCSVNNPLDFEARRQMLSAAFPDVTILYIKDNVSDYIWSANLDNQIQDIIGPNQKVVLYGSRDSFIPHYFGKFPTKELIQERFVSGSEIRKAISSRTKASPDFRAGVIWATHNQYPKVLTTVDVAIVNEDGTKLLVARKPSESLWRFIGGFSSATSPSFEADARREVAEEAHIEISDPEFLGSCLIDDWRYRDEVDKIKTLFFRAKHLFGIPRPDDDIAELQWLPVDSLAADKFVTEHGPLLEIFIRKLETCKPK